MIIGIVNQKGGVGKTATANNLAHYLKKNKKKTLLIDLDPQASLSKINKVFKDDIESNASKLILKKQFDRIKLDKYLDVIESNFDLDVSIKILEGKMLRENYLKKALEEVKKDYDYIVIDSPPSFNIVFLNILYAVDEIIIPVKPEVDSIQGLDYLFDTIRELKEIGKDIKINGILPVMLDKRRKQTKDILELLSKKATKEKTKIYPYIRQAAAVASYSKDKTNIFDTKKTKVRIDFEEFCKEFIKS